MAPPRTFDYAETSRRYLAGASVRQLADDLHVSVAAIYVALRATNTPMRPPAKPTVREHELLCTTCGRWKPDHDFPRARRKTARRARHATCRACSAGTRQQARENRYVPCVRCGKPRTNAADTGAAWRGQKDTGLCRDCYHANRAKLTHCKRGHEFTPENTYVSSNGYRNCRTCARERERARYYRDRQATAA